MAILRFIPPVNDEVIFLSSLGLSNGDDLTVASGERIVQDMAPTPTLGHITVNTGGKFELISNTELICEALHTSTGSLKEVLGGVSGAYETTPLEDCILTLNGLPEESGAPAISNDGHSRGFMTHGTANVKLRGWAPSAVVAYLTAHVEAGDSVVTLNIDVEAAGWRVGGRIGFAGTDFYALSPPELHVIAAIDGNEVTLVGTMAHDKWGTLQYLVDTGAAANAIGLSETPGTFTKAPDPDTPTQADQRGAVFYLDRGITVRAPVDAALTDDYFGVHMMFHQGTVDQLEGVCVENGGQAGSTGRYPFHDHMKSIDSTAISSTLITDLSSAVTLSPAGGCTLVQITASTTCDLRYTIDGSTPTGSTGLILAAGKMTTIPGVWNGSAFVPPTIKVIQTSSGGAVRGSWFGGDGSILDDTTSFWKKCVVLNSVQRAFVTHGTMGLLNQDCIAFLVNGMAFFEEDGVERRTVYDNCHAVGIEGAITGRVLKLFEVQRAVDDGDEAGPSGFWVTNPDTQITNCTGSNNNGPGAWLSFALRPFGLSSLVAMQPFAVQLGEVADNRWNSNHGAPLVLRGIVIDEAGATDISQIYIPTVDETSTGALIQRWYIDRQTNYKNGQGYRNNVSNPRYRWWFSSDNYGQHFAGKSLSPDYILSGVGENVGNNAIYGSVIFYNSLNNANPDRPAPLPYDAADIRPIGAATYHDTLSSIKTIFSGFPLIIIGNNGSGALSAADYYVHPNQRGTYFLEGNVFTPDCFIGYRAKGANQFPPEPGRNFCLAGTIWDPQGIHLLDDGSGGQLPGIPGQQWCYDDPFFTTGGINGYIWPQDDDNGVSITADFVGLLQFATSFDTNVYEFVGAIQIERQASDGTVLGTWLVPQGVVGEILAIPGRHVSMRLGGSGERYVLTWPGHSPPDYAQMQVECLFDSDFIVPLAVQINGANTDLFVVYGQNGQYSAPYGTVCSPAADLATVLAGDGSLYWQDTDNDLVWLRLVGQDGWSGGEPAEDNDVGLYKERFLFIGPAA